MERRDSVNQIKDIAYRAGQHISFNPENLGEHLLDSLESELQRFLSQLPEEVRSDYEARYIEKYKEWLYAMSRCFSQMITGAGGWKPATFRRHEKTNNAEHNARVRLDEWAEKVIKRCNRQERLTGWAEVERLQDKLESLTKLQEMMKAANKIVRNKRMSEVDKFDELAALGLTDEKAKELMYPPYSYHGIGFASFELSNNLAKIKDTEARLKRHEAMAQKEDTEDSYDWGLLRKVYSEERVRFIFNDIPSSKVRDILKSEGFKWSPKNSAWQRQLTPNALRATKRVLEKINTL